MDTWLRDRRAAQPLMKRFDRDIRHGIRSFSWFIYRMTSPAMRNLFLNPHNPLRMQEALLSLLSGDLFAARRSTGACARSKACTTSVRSPTCAAAFWRGATQKGHSGSRFRGPSRRAVLSSALAQALAYVDAQQLSLLELDPNVHVLGAIGHGERNEAGSSLVCAWSGLATHRAGPQFEAWTSRAPVTVETYDGTRCARNDEVLFGSIEFDPGNAGHFQQRTLEHYAKVFALIDAYGYPHLLRIWHYLPQIHLDEDGLERYRRFSVARYEAFVGSGRDIARDAPAASAVGKREGSAVFAFLAGKRGGTPIENPRQTSAYRYPVQYGPRGPTFARAAA